MEAETPYLWVGDVPVTSANAEDVLGEADEGATITFDPTSATLTLDGANITTGHVVESEYVFYSYGIYYTGSVPLTIAVASESTVDVSEITDTDTATGISCESSDLTITGAGKLTAKGRDYGISGYCNVTIDSDVVVASGGQSSIIAREGDVVINGGTVETDDGIFGTGVTINGGTVEASGVESAIYCRSVTISGGEVTATAGDGDGIAATARNNEPGIVTISGGTVSATGGANGRGIFAGCSSVAEVDKPGIVTISGGTVSATGGANGIYAQESSGTKAPGTVTIGGGVASVTASSGTKAVEGTVINAVTGMGWSDVAGTTDKAVITTTGNGQELSYKKVQFPMPVAKVVKPNPTNPTYNGKAQELVTAGTAEGGTMQYSLDGTTWSDKVPTGTEAKSYTVWYKAVGDESHGDTEPQSVKSTITNPESHKPTYAVTTGSGAEYARGSDGPLTFVFKRSESDDETFRRFKSASVDGRVMTRDRDYTASAGSLVIELQPSFLATLATGEHTLTATFDDGMAEAKFTVAQAKAHTTTAKSTLPKTGDPAPLVAVSTLAVTGAAFVAAGLRRGRKDQ